MFRPSQVTRAEPRRGVILMVVLALLTLFAVVGVSFVYYADAEAKAARISLEAEIQSRPDMDPELLLAYFLGQLLYDVDDQAGAYSALRGHSLVRLLYGSSEQDLNGIPFNGTGRLHTGSGTYMNPFNVDDYQLINYTFFPADGFLRDPERLGMRTSLTQPRGPYTGGFNAPYTYPDLNNMFLAAVKADGTVLMPSFHRTWLFNPSTGLNDPSNPNWTNGVGKYLLLRPRPADMGPGFPYPEDAGGDVKNLIGAPGGNDSLWIDLGAPVMMSPDGRKYKPLFAPLILDLDNRVNLNVHGNIRGANATHVSNQGWGPWEVNLGNVLTNGSEWTRLFAGATAPPLYGRYGIDQQPARAGSVAQAGMLPHFYGAVDYDGCNEQAGYVPTAQLQLPGAAGTAPFFCFPTFPQGYGSGSSLECTNHPGLYNVLKPAGDDRVLGVSNLEALLRFGDTGSQSLTSELLRLCPGNFTDARLRRLVTTLSADIDKPGVTPWVWDPGAQPYQLPAGSLAPSGGTITFPDLRLRTSSPVPAGSEFRSDWRARDAGLGRLDLSATLPDYPPPDPVTGRITDLVQFQAAQQARQQLAGNIFRRLWTVTGAGNPVTLPPPGSAGFDPLRWNALRWLAQLAANIVDFMDTDDYLTPFNWNGNDWVFGTELPRVVINEALAAYQPPPGGKADNSTVRVWVELLNTFNTDPTLVPPPGGNGGDAMLAVTGPGGYAVYQIALCQPDPTPPNSYYRRADNAWGTCYPVNLGDPKMTYPLGPSPGGPPLPGRALLPGDAGASTWQVPTIPASNGGAGGAAPPQVGYYVVGPNPIPGGGPNPDNMTNNLQPNQMTYQVATAKNTAPPAPTIMLQRLACPNLPPEPDRTQPLYNPYITVDYMQNVNASPAGSPTAGLIIPQNSTASAGGTKGMQADNRLQPYTGNTAMKALATASPGGHQPKSTFWGANTPPAGPATPPFQWLVHLDRPLISPMELLHVSAFKPQELTQQFVTAAGAFQHYAPWFDPGTHVYRVFELLETHDRAAGVTALLPGGRIPGKININTVWDVEIFRALCDAQTSNYFTTAQVDAMFGQLLALRTPNLSTTGLGPTDRPFLGLAAPYAIGDPQYPNGADINDTLLRSFVPGGGTTTTRLFQNTSVTHPYLQDEVLTKIFNHITTRSNVFAVWVTVGFFEVTDDVSRPVKLGAEIGRAENRHIRHRMFAIVDRSTLDANFGPQPRFNPRADQALVPYFSIIN